MAEYVYNSSFTLQIENYCKGVKILPDECTDYTYVHAQYYDDCTNILCLCKNPILLLLNIINLENTYRKNSLH